MLTIVLASVISFFLGFGVTKIKRRLPINIVGTLLLPSPEDDRWRRTTENVGFTFESNYLAIETIRVSPDTLWVDRRRITHKRAGRYADAVWRLHTERKALEAVGI